MRLDMVGDIQTGVGQLVTIPRAVFGEAFKPEHGAYWFRVVLFDQGHHVMVPSMVRSSAELADRLRVGCLVQLVDLHLTTRLVGKRVGAARLVSIVHDARENVGGQPYAVQRFQTLSVAPKAAA